MMYGVKIKKGEIAPVEGVIISLENYHILAKRKEYLQRVQRLEARLNAGEDV